MSSQKIYQRMFKIVVSIFFILGIVLSNLPDPLTNVSAQTNHAPQKAQSNHAIQTTDEAEKFIAKIHASAMETWQTSSERQADTLSITNNKWRLLTVPNVSAYWLQVKAFTGNTTATIKIYRRGNYNPDKEDYDWIELSFASCQSNQSGGCTSSPESVTLDPANWADYYWELFLSSPSGGFTHGQATLSYTENLLHTAPISDDCDTLEYSVGKGQTLSIDWCDINLTPSQLDRTIDPNSETYTVSSSNSSVAIVFSDTERDTTSSKSGTLLASIVPAGFFQQFYADGDAGQCNGAFMGKEQVPFDNWTSEIRIDTDSRGGGCLGADICERIW